MSLERAVNGQHSVACLSDITYTALYSKTRSEFTIGLLIFASVFRERCLVSPFVIGAFRFQLAVWTLCVLEPLLELLALSVLLYLSVKY